MVSSSPLYVTLGAADREKAMKKGVLHIVHWEMSGIYEVAKTMSEYGASLNEIQKIICLRKRKGKIDFILMFFRIFQIYRHSFLGNYTIHAHSFLPILTQAPIFWRTSAVTFHNSYPYLTSENTKSILKREILKFIFKMRSAKVSSVSMETASLVHEGMSIDSVVIYNGVDCRKYPYCTSTKVRIIGAAGRLDGQKNFSSLVKAVALVESKDFRIIIAGEGAEREELERLIIEKNVQDNISLIGYVEDMIDFYKSIDAFICTSVYEGFGLVLAEAILSGKSLASTRVGLISDIQSLQYFEVNTDPVSIASGISNLLSLTEGFISKSARANRKKLEEILSVKNMYDQYRSSLWG